jgi:hypothetical protein
MAGFIGINKMDPTTNLDVNGSAKISGNLEVGGSLGDATANNISVSTLKISDIIRLGVVENKSVSNINNDFWLVFPLPEIVLCDCTLGNMNLRVPNVSEIPTSATCKLHIRRINSNATVINLLPSITNDYVFYDYINQNVSSIPGIGNVNIILILYNRKWYFSQYS